MKQELERKILAKEDEIKKLNLDLDNYRNKLKGLTFDEFDIDDYIIMIALEMKKARDRIHELQYQVYELMQILKA